MSVESLRPDQGKSDGLLVLVFIGVAVWVAWKLAGGAL